MVKKTYLSDNLFKIHFVEGEFHKQSMTFQFRKKLLRSIDLSLNITVSRGINNCLTIFAVFIEFK